MKNRSPVGLLVVAVLAGALSLAVAWQALRQPVRPASPALAQIAPSAIAPAALHTAPERLESSRAGDPGRNSSCDAPPLLGDSARWGADESRLLQRCRQLARLPSATMQLAQSQARLAQLYGEALRSQPALPMQPELAARAQLMLTSSVAVYTTVLGPQASRTRMAARRLAQARRGQWSGEAPAIAARDGDGAEAEPTAAPLPAGLAPDAPAQAATQQLGAAAPLPAQQRAELAQLADDLARLRAQVASVTHDPQGFRARDAQAEAARSRCRDAACLQQWYARRRAQLLQEF